MVDGGAGSWGKSHTGGRKVREGKWGNAAVQGGQELPPRASCPDLDKVKYLR